ncbi:MAG: YraN family protein [Clostridia bacterium]|nr:YraN family protein [Clostridia bacterium]
MNKRKIGAQYEQEAVLFLQKNGVRILEQNFRNRIGEIDIIGGYQNTILFIEVKYRKDTRTGQPAEAVGYQKQRIISHVADFYRMKHQMGDDLCYRFDVIGILGDQITWYQDAFSYIR